MEEAKRLLREARAERRSPKNLEYCRPFREKRDELVEIVRPYQDQFQTLLQKCTRDVVSYQYATGGAVMHRGVYCPSPVLDIYTNVKRGRLLSDIKSKAKRSFKYGFDIHNRMRVVYRVEKHGSTEIILYEKDKELGLTFASDGLLIEFSVCTFRDERITEYISGIYQYWDESIHEFTDERYFYNEEGLCRTEIYDCFLDLPTVGHLELLFTHNEDGYLEKYTFVDYKYNEKMREIQHDVDVKRKI